MEEQKRKENHNPNLPFNVLEEDLTKTPEVKTGGEVDEPVWYYISGYFLYVIA